MLGSLSLQKVAKEVKNESNNNEATAKQYLDFVSDGLLRLTEQKPSLRAGLAAPEQTEPNLFCFLRSFVECQPVSAVGVLRKPYNFLI